MNHESHTPPVQGPQADQRSTAALRPGAATAGQVSVVMGRLGREYRRCVVARDRLRTALADAAARGDTERVDALTAEEAHAAVRVYLAEKRIATYERGVRGLIRSYRSRAVAAP